MVQSQTTITTLPLDLLNAITDTLGDSTTSLKALTLSSPVFLGPCRRILFHSLTVNVATRSKLDDFESFLQDAAQSTSGAVRKLTIIDTDPSATESPPFTKQLLTLILTCLTSLTHLTLDSIVLADAKTADVAGPEGMVEPQPAQKDLELLDLHLTRDTRDKFEDGLFILSAFRNVDTLRVRCAERGPAKPEVEPLADFNSTRGLSVQMLVIDDPSYTMAWFDLLSNTRSVGDPQTGTKSTLRSIDISCRTVEETERLGAFLRIAGANVSRVVYNVGKVFEGQSKPEDGTVLAKHLALRTSCPRLDNLHLRLSVNPFKASRAADTPTVIANVDAIARSAPTPPKYLFLAVDCTSIPLDAISRLRSLYEWAYQIVRDGLAGYLGIVLEVPDDADSLEGEMVHMWCFLARLEWAINPTYKEFSHARKLSIGFIKV